MLVREQFLKHVLLPATPSFAFAVDVATPVQVLGCRNRGLIAVSIALVTVLLALCSVIVALFLRIRKDPNSVWWIGTTLVLTIPAILLILAA